MERISIGEFIAQQSEALGSLDGNEMFARVSCSLLLSDSEVVVCLRYQSSCVAAAAAAFAAAGQLFLSYCRLDAVPKNWTFGIV